jgi:hypothetical protein
MLDGQSLTEAQPVNCTFFGAKRPNEVAKKSGGKLQPGATAHKQDPGRWATHPETAEKLSTP